MKRLRFVLAALGILPLVSNALAEGTVDFNRQIRPILSDNCFKCHGPDEQQRKAKLRLDTRSGATAALRGGGHAIVPGKAADSTLLERILAADPAERMPPAKTNKKLTPEQIELLRRWIAEGASYQEHWAFVAPRRPPLPKMLRTGARNAIDHFIQERLDKEGLKPAPEADRPTLIRRLSLDLTGLPPTPDEIDTFLADQSPEAYANLVERILSSPHYGERMALDWLDAARFADTHGYHIDAGRDMSLWREWVIDAFNNNLPFDRFTIEQIAGDLLPGATVRQKIASGFNRNHMINFEGGAIPEEYLNAYIVDRVNTTATVWLGLTLACSQCHDHKYDPISQKEYYQFYAFFHNVPENGLDGRQGNAAPMVKAPSKAQQQALDELERQAQELEAKLNAETPGAEEGQRAWEKTAAQEGPLTWKLLEATRMRSSGGATFSKQADRSIIVSGNNPATDSYTIEADIDLPKLSAFRLEALPQRGLKGNGPGRSINGNFVLTNVQASLEGKPLVLKEASASFSQVDYPVAAAIDRDPATGWAVHPAVGKPVSAVFSFDQPVKLSGKANLALKLEFQSEFGQHQLGHLRLAVTDSAQPHGQTTLPADVAAALQVPSSQRAAGQQSLVRTYYRTRVSPELASLRAELDRVRQARAAIEKQVPSAMVMQDLPAPRDTFMLVRGEYDKRGQKVTAGTPGFLPPLPQGQAASRLSLARWLVDPAHPLTSRVIVNRYWQMFFGTGLVKTAEDFGSQGEQPSHPELLDWLAVEFRESGWDVKKLVRLIVESATYRQSSVVQKERLARDAENRLLARGPRLRLQAEFIRDQALAISGLLNHEIGGASVNPYQPAGLWQELAARTDSKNWSAQFFVQSHGKDLYRRTMYTFWKRTSPPPTLVTFDAPDRETCTVRRSRTNTPLQALVLMNDPTYVEASRKLAERMLRHAPTADKRLAFAFRLATARLPSERETNILLQVLERQRQKYTADPEAASKLLAVGEAPHALDLSADELAAYAIVASVILNLDETVTKN